MDAPGYFPRKQRRSGLHSGMLDLDPVRPQLQPGGYDAEAELARDWALGYWQRAAELVDLSAGMRRAYGQNVQRLQSGFTGLP